MAKSTERDAFSSSDQPQPFRALLVEIKGTMDADIMTAATVSTEMFAALSIEEVIAHLRTHQPGFEITELKVLGKVQVLSSSEHLV